MPNSRSLSLARLAPHLPPLTLAPMLAVAIGWGGGFLSPAQALAFVIALAPCVLVSALPVVPFFALRSLQSRDIRLKNACVLDRIAATDTLVLDGAAALFAAPRLANPSQIGSRNMQIAASLGARSDDPLMKALFDMYGGKILDFETIQSNEQGLKASLDGKSVTLSRYPSSPSDLWLDVTGFPCVRFIFAFEPKPEAQSVLAAFQKDGKRIVFLNNEKMDLSVSDLAINDVSRLSKPKLLKDLHIQRAKVLWLNACKDDLPLAKNDVFISTSGDTTADVVLRLDKGFKPLGFLLHMTAVYENVLSRHVLIALMATGLLLALAFSHALSVENGLSALVAFAIGLFFSARQSLQKGHASVTA